MKYKLIMMNDQGACETTAHRTKKQIRAQIRQWQAKQMRAFVYRFVCDCLGNTIGAEEIYHGRALGFK
jgi:hypothetical protein